MSRTNEVQLEFRVPDGQATALANRLEDKLRFLSIFHDEKDIEVSGTVDISCGDTESHFKHACKIIMEAHGAYLDISGTYQDLEAIEDDEE